MKTGADKIFENCILFNDNLSDLPSSAGLVLFADGQDLPIQLLTSANIRRTAKNKLAEQIETTKKVDLKSITAKIYYKICPCKFRLALAHLRAARKVFGQNYKDHITLVRPAYIKTCLNAKIPSFSITRKPAFKDSEKILGPVPSQRSATVFLKALENAFRLCKRNDLVDSPETAKSCPYIQMDACCGVCGGKINTQDYQLAVKNAFEAGTNPQEAIEKLKAQMQRASAELSFEKAAELKRKIGKLSVLTKQTYRWTDNLEKLKIVHIDKSAKIKVKGVRAKKQTFAVFAISFFKTVDLGDFLPDDIDSIVEAINKEIESLRPITADVGDMNELAERFSIVSYFLYRSKPTGLWINASAGFDEEELQKLKV